MNEEKNNETNVENADSVTAVEGETPDTPVVEASTSENEETANEGVTEETVVEEATVTVMTEESIDDILDALDSDYGFQQRIEAGSYVISSFDLTLETGDRSKENKISGKTLKVIRLVCKLEGSSTDWVKTYSVGTVDTMMKHFNLTSNTSGRYVSIVRDGVLVGLDAEKLSEKAVGVKILTSGTPENRKFRPRSISAGEYWYLKVCSAINAGDYSHFSVEGETVVIGGGTSAHIARGSMSIESEEF